MAAKGNTIQFLTGTYAQYSKLTTKDANSIYFCEDTRQLFVGDVEYTRSVGDGKVTIKQAGVNVGTFTLNQIGNTNVEIAEVIDYSVWKDMTTEQRDAKGLVIVTNTPN